MVNETTEAMNQITIRLSNAAMNYVSQLRNTKLWGATDEAVIESLVMDGLRRAAADGILRLHAAQQ